MIKRVLVHAAFIILLTALQTTWLSELPVTPCLLLIFSVFAALFEGPVSGGVYGLICGILTDTFSGGPAFLNTLLFLYICVVVGLVSGRIISRTPLNAILITTAFSGVYFLIYYFFSLIIWGEGYSFFRFLFIFVVFVLFCGISASVLYAPVRRSFRGVSSAS